LPNLLAQDRGFVGGESMSTHNYIALGKCGCPRGCVVDDPQYPSDTADAVAEFIRSGFTVDRLPFEDFKARWLAPRTCTEHPETRAAHDLPDLPAQPEGRLHSLRKEEMTPNYRTKNSNLSDADLCRKNGWRAGTVLEGDGNPMGPKQIKITAVGEDYILGKWLPDGPEEDLCLTVRDWREVKA
jgi:hypothetical protein